MTHFLIHDTFNLSGRMNRFCFKKGVTLSEAEGSLLSDFPTAALKVESHLQPFWLQAILSINYS